MEPSNNGYHFIRTIYAVSWSGVCILSGERDDYMSIKTGLVWKAVVPAIVVTISVMLMVACTDANLPDTATEEAQETSIEPVTPEAEEGTSDNSFEQYLSYLGVSREQLENDLGTSTKIDEGGLEFKDAKIRIWFESDEDTAKSISVWIDNPEVDYNGIKRGEHINRFREVFGVPLSDNTASAEAIFVYEQVWLIVDYDPNTGKTAAVYVSSPTNPNFINPITESTAAEIQNTMGIKLNLPYDAQNVEYSMIDSGEGKVIAQAKFVKTEWRTLTAHGLPQRWKTFRELIMTGTRLKISK